MTRNTDLVSQLVIKVANLEAQMKDEVLCNESGHSARINRMEHRWTAALAVWGLFLILGGALSGWLQHSFTLEMKAAEQRVISELRGRRP